MALQEELKKQGDFLFKYRSYLPLVLLVGGVGIKVYQDYYMGNVDPGMLHKVLVYSSVGVGVLGLLIRIFTVGYTPINTSGRNTTEGQVADELNTTGIYSLIRNPLYLGNYLMWVAIAMLTGNIWFVLLFSFGFWIYYERIVYAEEQFLRNKFGKTYLDWTEKTGIFLPRHFNYKKPSIHFSWRKVAKKEKNGLFALFLLFWVFEAIGQYVKTGVIELEGSWTFIAAIASGFIYLVLKILKRAKLLDGDGR